ncbi:MAG: hypothetical protein ACE5JU_16205 [Candidatus Binatia bacterium]
MTFFFAAVSAAQPFRLGNLEGVYETVNQYTRQETQTGSGNRSRLQGVISESRLTLRNRGAYIFDPRLITFSLGGTFGLSQDWLRTDTSKKSSQGVLLGYDFFASLLPAKAFSLDLFANQDRSVQSGDLAGRIEIETENRGSTLFARRLYIPSKLTFRQEVQSQESRSGGVVTRRAERRNIVTYEGQRGWIDSEMGIRYEFIDSSDEVFPTLSFRSHEGSLYYSLDFGPGLNRRWDSRMRLFTRLGFTDLTTLNIDEALHIDHTERLKTDYRYTLLRVATTGGTTTTHTGAFDLRHRLYESLTTNLGLDANVQKFADGERDEYRTMLDLSYTKRLPRNGRLNIGLAGGFRYTDSRFRTTETFVPQETHAAAFPFALPIEVNNPFVIVGSVVVTKIALGPLPVGCIPPPGPPTSLVLGQDYTLSTVDDITRIVPIPCAGAAPGINPGDTIAVDYRFGVSPSLTYATVPLRLNLSVDYRWIRPYFIHEQEDKTLLSGRDGQSLDDHKSDTIGTELRYESQRIQGSLVGEFQRFTSQRNAFNMVRSNQFLGYRILPQLTLTLSGDESLLSYSRPEDRERRTVGGRATLTYQLGATLFAQAFAGITAFTDTSQPNESVSEANLRIRWMYRRVEVLPSFRFFDRRRGDTDTKEFRATLRLIRRF